MASLRFRRHVGGGTACRIIRRYSGPSRPVNFLWFESRLGAGSATDRHCVMSRHVPRRRIVLSAIALLVLLAAGAWFVAGYYSFDRRFARSKAELDAYAAQVMAAGSAAALTPPAMLGSFEASDAFRLPQGFVFRADYGHPLDWNGLAYSIDPLPGQMPDPHPPFQAMFFKPIQGNWYMVWRN